jgi:hypothetical protein
MTRTAKWFRDREEISVTAISLSTALGAFLFVALPLAVSFAQGQQDASAESAAIMKAAVGFIEPFKHHDPDAAAMAFTEDAGLLSMAARELKIFTQVYSQAVLRAPNGRPR